HEPVVRAVVPTGGGHGAGPGPAAPARSEGRLDHGALPAVGFRGLRRRVRGGDPERRGLRAAVAWNAAEGPELRLGPHAGDLQPGVPARARRATRDADGRSARDAGREVRLPTER